MVSWIFWKMLGIIRPHFVMVGEVHRWWCVLFVLPLMVLVFSPLGNKWRCYNFCG